MGITRARRRLFLTHATTRLFFGETRWQSPSIFLDELPPEVIEGGGHAFDEDETTVLGKYDDESEASLAVGMLVRHHHFGMGTIEQLTGSGVNARATVRFTHHGTKQLLLQYAGLEAVK